MHWTPAVVIDRPGPKRNAAYRVGLADGRVLPLRSGSATILRKLNLYDVVFVKVTDAKGRAAARADLRVRPVVQGAALVLENKTGRILAMAGGFSYGLSQLNRTSQSRRQPGSAIKPITYLAALRAGLQPNTLVRDEPVTLPPINGGTRERDYWSPKNYDGGAWGVVTLRRALENSRNLATVGLLDGAIESTAERSLDRVCELAQEAQLYAECQHYYPIVLGAQPVRLIDLAAFYAAIANEGARPSPHAIASVEQDGRVVYPRRHQGAGVARLRRPGRVLSAQVDAAGRGRCAAPPARCAISRPISPARPAPARTRTTPGSSASPTTSRWRCGSATTTPTAGARSAAARPAATSRCRSSARSSRRRGNTWRARPLLAPPSAEAKRQLVMLPVDLRSGSRVAQGGRLLRRRAGHHHRSVPHRRARALDDTQYRIVSELDAQLRIEGDQYGEQQYPGSTYGDRQNPDGYYYRYYGGPRRATTGRRRQSPYQQPYQQPQYNRGLFGSWSSPPPERPAAATAAPDRSGLFLAQPDQLKRRSRCVFAAFCWVPSRPARSCAPRWRRRSASSRSPRSPTCR